VARETSEDISMSQTSSENANSIEAASASEDDAAFSSATEKDGELAALPTSVVMRTHMSDDTGGCTRNSDLIIIMAIIRRSIYRIFFSMTSDQQCSGLSSSS
jgi:hypothetical protein